MASVRKREWSSPDGKVKSAWEVAYRDQDQKRRSKQFKMKKSADAFMLKVQTEIEQGVHVAESQTRTIKEVCRSYLIYSETRVADGRIGRNRHRSIDMAVRRSIVPNIGALNIADLTPLRVERLYEAMTTKDGLAPRSARYRLQMLRQIGDFAVKHGHLKRNPVGEGIRELRGAATPVIRTFSPDEIGRLLKAAAVRVPGGHHHTTLTLNLAVNLAAFCGLRFGEIMGLSLGNIDFGRRLLCVRRSLSRLDGLKGPKTPAGRRDIPMPTHIASMLRAYIAEFYKPNPDELIVRTNSGGRLLSSSFHSSHWPRLLSRAGLLDDGERYHFHALRHFAASWMIENGLPVTDVAMLLGHAKFDMTLQVYAHPIVGGSHRHEALERMSQTLIAAPLVVIDAASERHSAKNPVITVM